MWREEMGHNKNSSNRTSSAFTSDGVMWTCDNEKYYDV